MNEFRYTLLSDGPSDRALMPLLDWLLRQQRITRGFLGHWADLGRLRKRPPTLADRIRLSIELYPCELLFVHRDAEAEPRSVRVGEITRSLQAMQASTVVPPVVCVVPVRMMEAWLLFDEAALRRAAGNPSGQQVVTLPRVAELDRELDPKETLHTLLRSASGHGRHRLRQSHVPQAVQRLAELIEDFAPLRALPAFGALEGEVALAVQENGWNKGDLSRAVSENGVHSRNRQK